MEALKKIIEQLTQEAINIQIQGRALRTDEMARLQVIHQALPHLKESLSILSTKVTSTLITYKIVSDLDGKLKRAAKIACNFWNRFIIPNSSIIIRLGTFYENSNTIARAYKPYIKDGIAYGIVEFNTKYLSTYSLNKTSGTIVHEIAHTLGIGWDKWMQLYDRSTGIFTNAATNVVPDLKYMRVELEGRPGTIYSHWDEEKHNEELMTGYQDYTEHVLPVTIDIMKLLGHKVIEQLPKKTDLDTLLNGLAQIMFSRQSEAKAIDLDYFEQTDLWENIPHSQPLSKKDENVTT